MSKINKINYLDFLKLKINTTDRFSNSYSLCSNQNLYTNF